MSVVRFLCVCVCVSQFHFIGIMMEQTVLKNREKQLDGHAIQFDNFNHVHLTFNTIFNFTWSRNETEQI